MMVTAISAEEWYTFEFSETDRMWDYGGVLGDGERQ